MREKWACLQEDGKRGEQASVTSSPNDLQGVSGQGGWSCPRVVGSLKKILHVQMCVCVYMPV